jgi:hypothetical protein
LAAEQLAQLRGDLTGGKIVTAARAGCDDDADGFDGISICSSGAARTNGRLMNPIQSNDR